MSRYRVLGWIALALAVGSSTSAAGYAVSAPDHQEPTLGPGVVRVEMGIEDSRFSIAMLRVWQGTMVEFLVRNDDPIAHELVVGSAAVHREHEIGSERRHPPVPGEVSVGPGERGLTFVVFDEPGVVEFACHLPGHRAYGMSGEIEVLPSS